MKYYKTKHEGIMKYETKKGHVTVLGLPTTITQKKGQSLDSKQLERLRHIKH